MLSNKPTEDSPSDFPRDEIPKTEENTDNVVNTNSDTGAESTKISDEQPIVRTVRRRRTSEEIEERRRQRLKLKRIRKILLALESVFTICFSISFAIYSSTSLAVYILPHKDLMSIYLKEGLIRGIQRTIDYINSSTIEVPNVLLEIVKLSGIISLSSFIAIIILIVIKLWKKLYQKG